MNKSMLLIAVALILAVALSSCSNYSIVEFPDGQRVEVRNTMYLEGDTVCIYQSMYGDEISQTFWQDTSYCGTMPDSSSYCALFRMGVIIDE